ncbi:MAG: hypothetical protein ACOYJZ_07535 [Acutalibacter sp.]
MGRLWGDPVRGRLRRPEDLSSAQAQDTELGLLLMVNVELGPVTFTL